VFQVTAALDMEERVVQESLEELEVRKFIRWDPGEEVLLYLEALRYNPLKAGKSKDGEPKDDKRLPGALKAIEDLGDSPLLPELLKVADRVNPYFAQHLRNHFPHLEEGEWGKPHASPLEAPWKGRIEKTRLDYEKNRKDTDHEKTRHEFASDTQEDRFASDWGVPAKIRERWSS
jgi:hypothetical protein